MGSCIDSWATAPMPYLLQCYVLQCQGIRQQQHGAPARASIEPQQLLCCHCHGDGAAIPISHSARNRENQRREGSLARHSEFSELTTGNHYILLLLLKQFNFPTHCRGGFRSCSVIPQGHPAPSTTRELPAFVLSIVQEHLTPFAFTCGEAQ